MWSKATGTTVVFKQVSLDDLKQGISSPPDASTDGFSWRENSGHYEFNF
jgi:hypothetical protein